MLLDLAEKAIKLATNLGAEYADVRTEQTHSTEIRLTNGTFEQVISGTDQGLGIRALFSGAWGFSSTSSLKMKNIKEAVENAVKTAKATSKAIKEKTTIHPIKPVKDHVITKVHESLAETEINRKMEMVLYLSKKTREYSPKIVSTNILYSDQTEKQAIATSEGTRILTEPSQIYVSITAIAKHAEKITSCRERMGMLTGFEFFTKVDMDEKAKLAAKRAENLLKAKPAPSGRFTVIADQNLASVFAHEAVGHGCEADLIIAGSSILEGKLGKQVGSEIVSIIDDSTLPKGFGSRKFDAEGVPTKKRLLMDHGILKTYITNREAASKLNMLPNGGARAQSFSYRPIVRMSNTYIAKGDHTFEELLEDINHGVYLKGTRGGQVDTAKGTFQFNAEEAYMIEKGKLVTPILDVSLSGLTLETLHNIDAIGKDFEVHVGFCGKNGQMVPVGNASPHVRIKNALVGGRA